MEGKAARRKANRGEALGHQISSRGYRAFCPQENLQIADGNVSRFTSEPGDVQFFQGGPAEWGINAERRTTGSALSMASELFPASACTRQICPFGNQGWPHLNVDASP